MSEFCDMCGRILTDPVSVRHGVGPECMGRYATQSAAVNSVKATVTAGDFEHPLLARALMLLSVAEAHAETSATARREVLKQRRIVANWAAKIEDSYGITLRISALPSLDPADRANDGDAARPTLTPTEQADANEFDATWRAMAAQDEPLDGCEEKTETPRASLLGWWNAAVAA